MAVLLYKFQTSLVARGTSKKATNTPLQINQLLRSATSIGANVREAQNAESESDFVHKLKIAAKEAEETMYWLDLCLYSPTYPNTENEKTELLSIIRIINKIIGTIKTKHQLAN